MKHKSLLLFHKVSELIFLIIGPFVAACGITLFYTPAKITGGGATGIGTIFFYLFGFDQGIVMMCINVPLIFFGMKVFGFKYGIRTLIGSTLLSLWVSVLGNLTNYSGFLNTQDTVNVLLSAIFGGVLLGGGIGITMKSGCNTGGTDIIAQVISHYTPINIGSVQFVFNAIVVTLSGIFLGLQPMLFAIIAMFVSAQMVNFVLTGFGTKMAKAVYIISDYRTIEISRRVIAELGHSGTIFEGTGMYTAKMREMLLVVVPNHQFQKLVNIIHEEDPTAFVFVNEAYEVLGRGFTPITKVVSSDDE